jgi:hypothetical protein
MQIKPKKTSMLHDNSKFVWRQPHVPLIFKCLYHQGLVLSQNHVIPTCFDVVEYL